MDNLRLHNGLPLFQVFTSFVLCCWGVRRGVEISGNRRFSVFFSRTDGYFFDGMHFEFCIM